MSFIRGSTVLGTTSNHSLMSIASMRLILELEIFALNFDFFTTNKF